MDNKKPVRDTDELVRYQISQNKALFTALEQKIDYIITEQAATRSDVAVLTERVNNYKEHADTNCAENRAEISLLRKRSNLFDIVSALFSTLAAVLISWLNS